MGDSKEKMRTDIQVPVSAKANEGGFTRHSKVNSELLSFIV